MTDLPVIPILVVALILSIGWIAASVFRRETDAFRDHARLFDLRRELREEQIARERLAALLYDLQNHVARLEDPLGKKKRGRGIYADLSRAKPIVGMAAFEAYDPRVAETAGDDGQTADAPFVYTLSDDGELKAGKEDGHEA